MLKLDQAKQVEVINHISTVFTNYEDQTQQWRSRMTAIYKGVTTFTSPKTQPRETGFKINKMHEYENRIVPRIMSKKPEPMVAYISDDFIDQPELDIGQVTEAVEDKLKSIYKKQDMIESLRLRARYGVRYGIGFAKLMPKYRIKRKPKTTYNEVIDEQGNVTKEAVKQIDEEVYEQYTSIDIKSFTDMYFDPRYTRLEDMPSIIDISRNVRLSYFTKNPKKFMNLDMLKNCCIRGEDYNNMDGYRQRIASITGIAQAKVQLIKPDSLDVKCYYGYYDLSDSEGLENEKLYEFRVVNDTVMVYACEIAFMPYEDFRVFEDTDTYFATGFLEPILGLQDEMNWKKNRASEYVNKTLKPDYIRSPISGIDPRKINQGHGNLLVTNKDAQTALANLVQIPLKDLNASYFNEQNDIERQFQSATFTVNTNSPITQNSLTNTATGAKIQNFDTDSVMGEVRTHFEEALVRLSYKLLQSEYDNSTENMTVRRSKDEESFWDMNKEVIADAISRYEITIEAGSSSFDSQDERRNDAIAQWNIGMQAQQAGMPVDLKKRYEKVMITFPNVNPNELFDQQQMMQPQQPQQVPQQEPIPTNGP